MSGRTYTLTRLIDAVTRHLPRPGRRACPLDEACGAYAADDIDAPAAVPPVHIAAVDGFSLPPGTGGGTYRVTGTFEPHRPPRTPPESGTAHRVEAGTPLPPGCPVVPAGLALLVGTDTVRLADPDAGAVQEPGSFLRSGTTIVSRGGAIDARTWGLLAACGIDTVDVIDAPAVHVLSVGTELESPHGREVSGRYLVRFLQELGVPAGFSGTVPDCEETIRRQVVSSFRGGLLVVCGGTGGGLTDRTVAALRPGGIRILCERIALVPGETTAAAVGLNGAALFLPGAPDAALAVAHCVIKPVLARWLGLDIAVWTAAERLPLAAPVEAGGDRYLCLGAVRRGNRLSAAEEAGRGGLFGAAVRMLVPPSPTGARSEGIVLEETPD